MNVLHLNQSDIGGGAAIAAYRLHHALRQLGVDSRLLVPSATLSEETTTILPPMSLTERILFKLTFPVAPNNTNILRTWKIPKMDAYQKADVINFHNLHTGLFFNYLSIPRITREKPVVFTLHDMWSFTGHCTYSYDCERWLQGCGKCPYPETYPAVQWDNTAIEWWLKKQVYSRSRLTIVTPSQWLSNLARKSSLGRFPIHTIPNGIDTDIYRPMDKAASRQQLGLPADGVILMFGCADLQDFRKGMDLLVRLLQALPEKLKSGLVLYAMGHDSSGLHDIAGIRTIRAGYVEDDGQKARCYSAADIFISTTRADNLPLVLLESLACGTPLLVSRVGGTSDVVRDGMTGFAVPPDDESGLLGRLVELIQNTQLRGEISARCRQVALEEYASAAIAQKYAALYESLIQS
jgi:glycosyltransferase involved in cell wall biosynthesis